MATNKVTVSPSLEDTCFDQILGSLANGEYSIDQLSLLPTDYRTRLLVKSPPAIVRQSENTQFTVGIDMELIWKKMYEQYVQNSKPKKQIQPQFHADDDDNEEDLYDDDADQDDDPDQDDDQYPDLDNDADDDDDDSRQDSSMPSAKLHGAIDDTKAIVLTSYNALKKLSLDVRGEVSVDLEKFIAITKHQSSLETISMTTFEIEEYDGCRCGGKLKATHSPKFSLPMLDSWYQVCLAKPTLRHITLNLSPITAKFLVQAVIDFLSTPCSQEQILSFDYMSLGKVEDDDIPWYQKPKAEQKLFKHVEVDTSELNLKQFDSQYTLQYKSIEFSSNCRFTPTFISFFSSLPPFKLKKLSYGKTTWLSHNPERDAFFLKLFTQQHFDMQTLELVWVVLEDATFEHYDALFQKESLKTVVLDTCRGVDKSALTKAASQHGFTFAEEVGPFGCKYTAYKLTKTL